MKNKKKRKGFTLIELLAVIIVLAIIALIATPIIFNVIENAKIKSLENSCYGVIDAVRTKYAEELLNLNKITNGNVNELTVSGEKPIDGTWTIDNSKDSEQRGIKIDNVRFSSMKDYACSNDLETGKVSCKKTYKDNSSANTPTLFKNMVPIKYENNKWIIADLGQKWYDYDAKEWANAVVLNSGVTKNVGDEVTEEEISLWYVWVPRYKYTIFNGNNGSVSEQLIDVTFENDTERTGTVSCYDNFDEENRNEICGDRVYGSVKNNKSTYTHPAFKFGNTELTGFWVGKFEVSGSTSAITIQPNVPSLRSETVSSFFTAIQNVKTTYGINNADSHMMKNMEWGAVAYLKQSKYGLGTTDIAANTNSSYYTGGGQSDAYKTNVVQSTTGNIYGVYDMSGGAYEYVMGNIKNSSNTFYSSNAGFATAPDAKYYDSYKYDSSSNTTHARGKLGDATKETLATFGNTRGGWYSDYASFPGSSDSWFGRGGYYGDGTDAGVFIFGGSYGGDVDYYSARAVLTAE